MATASRILLCSNSENRTGPRRKVSWLSLPLKPKVLVVHRCAGIDPNIEGLANRKQERDRVRHLQRGDVLAVHLHYAGAALCDAGAVICEIEHDGVLARRERLLAFAWPTPESKLPMAVGGPAQVTGAGLNTTALSPPSRPG
jgi:hypothetical protein